MPEGNSEHHTRMLIIGTLVKTFKVSVGPVPESRSETGK